LKQEFAKGAPFFILILREDGKGALFTFSEENKITL
jgi:hypothetical protein